MRTPKSKALKDELKFAGVDYNSEQKYFMKHLVFETQPDLAGEGTPVSRNAARAMIDEYLIPLEQEFDEAIKELESGVAVSKRKLFEVLNKTIAFTFGKETLLTILSQKECEGIRFYMAKKPTIIEGQDIPEGAGELTLVATGVTLKEGEIVDLGTQGSIISIQDTADYPTFQGEVVPPTNLKNVILEFRQKEDKDLRVLNRDISTRFNLRSRESSIIKHLPNINT